jgi:hypothetical protein
VGVPRLSLYLSSTSQVAFYSVPFTSFSFHMTKTTQLLTRPATGTVVKPVFEYDEEQKEKLQALREVSLCCILAFIYDSKSIHLLPLPPLHLSLLVL